MCRRHGNTAMGRVRHTPAPKPQSYLLVLILPRVVLLQPVGQGPVLEGAGHPVFHLDLAQGLGVRDHLHHPSAPARGEAAENHHAHVQPLLDPDLTHDANHLQGEHVLAKVVPALEDDSDVLTQRVHILEGELEGDCIGVEVRTVLS